MVNNKKILIIAGEPNSINSEIIFLKAGNDQVKILKKKYMLSEILNY